MSLIGKWILEVKFDKITLARRKDNKITDFRKAQDGDKATQTQAVTGSKRECEDFSEEKV